VSESKDESIEKAVRLVLRMLQRRVGTISLDTEAQVCTLSLPQLEDLGKALLDFSELDDLENWLRILGELLSREVSS
jgi:Domain of unknown function (DUF4351)